MSLLIIISCIDLHTFEIHDVMNFLLLGAGIIISLAYPHFYLKSSHLDSLFISIKGALAGGAVIFLLRVFGKIVFKKEAMGEGDIFLAAGIGSFVGWSNLFFVFFSASVAGVIVGIILRIIKGQEYIPFGPYLSLGAVTCIFWGQKFWDMILSGMVP